MIITMHIVIAMFQIPDTSQKAKREFYTVIWFNSLAISPCNHDLFKSESSNQISNTTEFCKMGPTPRWWQAMKDKSSTRFCWKRCGMTSQIDFSNLQPSANPQNKSRKDFEENLMFQKYRILTHFHNQTHLLC
jgi:hypothetical protein